MLSYFLSIQERQIWQKNGYIFEEVAEAEKYAGDWEGVRALLGGKAPPAWRI